MLPIDLEDQTSGLKTICIFDQIHSNKLAFGMLQSFGMQLDKNITHMDSARMVCCFQWMIYEVHFYFQVYNFLESCLKWHVT